MGRPKGSKNKNPLQRDVILEMLKNNEQVFPTEIDEKLQRSKISANMIGQLRDLGHNIESVRDGIHVVSYRYLGEGTPLERLEAIRTAAEKFEPPVLGHGDDDTKPQMSLNPYPELTGVLYFKGEYDDKA
jgi:hypothetical protein